MSKRITITPERLAESLVVWFRIAPTHLWREMAKQEEAEHMRPGGNPTGFDARRAMAEFIMEKFRTSRWEVTRPDDQIYRDGHSQGTEKE